MNRRQKIIVSVTGIFLILLILLGLTYAYFLTRINGNKNDESINVTTANLVLEYADLDDEYIIGKNEIIEPGKTFDAKTFTVTNKGNAAIDNYAVILEDVKTYYSQTFVDENDDEIEAGTPVSFARPQDFKISIRCYIESSPDETRENKSCYGLEQSTLPLMQSETLNETYITNGILVKNSIGVGEVHRYDIYLEYEEANTNQSADMNKVLEGKFNIIDANETVDITGTVTGFTPGDTIVTNSVRRESQINSDGSYKIVGLESGIHSIKKKSVNTETEISKLSIIKGETASVETIENEGITINQLVITDNSRTATVHVNTLLNSITPNEEIKDVNLITFTIPGDCKPTGTIIEDGGYSYEEEICGNSSYQAEEGMTWAQWVDSEYNTFEFKNSGYRIYLYKFGKAAVRAIYKGDERYEVSPDEVIESNYEYGMVNTLAPEFDDGEDTTDPGDEGEPTLITFSIGGSDFFQAEEGMTWGEWVESDYNNAYYRASGDYIVDSCDYILMNIVDEHVSLSDVIISDDMYLLDTSVAGTCQEQ